MISICTPTYNTDPIILARTWASLKSQTYTDWEWVVWDDSTNSNTWNQIYGLASDERFRLMAHKSHVHSGGIGRVKRQCMMAAEGNILVELDHDDELMPDALQLIADAFSDPEVGFVYSDWSEILPDGQSGRYPDGWAFGYGSEGYHLTYFRLGNLSLIAASSASFPLVTPYSVFNGPANPKRSGIKCIGIEFIAGNNTSIKFR